MRPTGPATRSGRLHPVRHWPSRSERNTLVLTDEEARRLARWGVRIEAHYGKPMDIEWAKDGRTGELFILQARPESRFRPACSSGR